MGRWEVTEGDLMRVLLDLAPDKPCQDDVKRRQEWMRQNGLRERERVRVMVGWLHTGMTTDEWPWEAHRG